VRKFSWEDAEVLDLLNEYTNDAVHVEVRGTLHGVCRDSKDDMIFECAVRAEAELIISGDLDLLTVESYGRIRVLTARQYLDQIASQSS
jgi:putative PIN family toxin of toxin-antitoxin system